MLMTEDTREMLNRLLQLLFDGNARIDNFVYNLSYHHKNNLAEAMHKPVAHELPVWADMISDKMDELNARQVRYGLSDHTEELNTVEVFEGLYNYFNSLRINVNKAIEEADDNGDAEVRIFLEDFLNNKVTRFYKQAEEWLDAAKRLNEDTLNIHIADYTHYLKK